MRLFIGIAPDHPARRALAGMAGGVPGARWSPPENLHLTLRFLGETSRAVAEDVVAELATVTFTPFALTYQGAGVFGDRKRARVLWAGIAASDGLTALQRRVEMAVQAAGCKPEGRKYAPHVTLARLRNAPWERLEQYVADHAAFRTEAELVDHFYLYESLSGEDGPRYIPLIRFSHMGEVEEVMAEPDFSEEIFD